MQEPSHLGGADMKCLGVVLPDINAEWCKSRYDNSRFSAGCDALLLSQPPQENVTVGESNCTALQPDLSLQGSGYFIYPPDGYMGWHTNSDRPGRRIYASWSETGDSGMLWWRDGRVVVDKDEQGWNIRTFVTPCWHAVWSKCWRVSIGFWVQDGL